MTDNGIGHNLRIASFNAQVFSTAQDELTAFIIAEKIDIICIQETGFNNKKKG